MLERRAADAADGLLRRLLNNALRAASVRYVLQFGSLEADADPLQAQTLVDEFIADVEDLRGYDPAPAIQSLVRQAGGRGVVWGRGGSPPGTSVDTVTSDAADRVVSEIPAGVDRALDTAQLLAQSTPVSSWDDVVRFHAAASKAVLDVDRAVSTATYTAFNDAVHQVAQAAGAKVLWIAEPDACVVCLALSGRLADPTTGRWFDEEATFGRPGSAPAVWPPGQPLKRPPRHPNCRCMTQVWWGDARGPDAFDLPAALRREARRSILLGRARPTESAPARLDAAARLLALGSGLPKSVEARARRAVKTGRFINRGR